MHETSMRVRWSMALLALGASACGGADAGTENEFLAGVPEQGALELRLTEDIEAEALAQGEDQVGAALASDALGLARAALEAEPADGLRRTREAVRELNQALRDFLQPIAALVRDEEPSAVQGNLATWGPVTRGSTEYRLLVRKGLLRRFGWVLQARPESGGDEFSNVAAGSIRVGSVVRRGRGVVGVDLDALGSVDPTVEARGQLLAAFAHGPAGTSLAYGLKDFTPHAADDTPIDAAFQGVHLNGGYHRVRLAFHGDLPETQSDAEELVLARVRHHRGEGGRADLLASGGDIADGKVWLVSECWSGGLVSAYRIVRECPGDGIGGERCTEHGSSGDPAACLGDLARAEFPPQDAEEPMEDPESPEQELLPPLEMPAGDPDDAP